MLAQILLQALQNSNNEKFFTFVLENIEMICTWLNSSEFRDKYLSTKHPYPPLINPEFIETDASRHCAELAWDLNLPLPQHYKFIYISPHGVGAAAFLRYLNQCCIVIKTHVMSTVSLLSISRQAPRSKTNQKSIYPILISIYLY